MFLRALVVCLAVFPFAAHAERLPDPLSDTVSDFANLLSPEAEGRIAQALKEGRKETGAHVVVVTMDHLANYGGAGQDIADYAKSIFNQWGVGDSSRDDGIMILVVSQDRVMRIALGAGYPVVWDNAAQRVIDNFMLPEFREDRYEAGIEAGVAATFRQIVRPFQAGETVTEPTSSVPVSETISNILIGMIFAAFMVFTFFKRRIGDLFARFRACPHCGAHQVTRTSSVISSPTRMMTGSGMRYYHCAACSHDWQTPYVISKISDSDSSSGGFGGGSSSGGGASGKW